MYRSVMSNLGAEGAELVFVVAIVVAWSSGCCAEEIESKISQKYFYSKKSCGHGIQAESKRDLRFVGNTKRFR